jgi:hypothetical protein
MFKAKFLAGWIPPGDSPPHVVGLQMGEH